MKIKELMQKDVVAVDCDVSALELPSVLTQKRLGALPVISDTGQLMGILSMTDVLRKLASVMGKSSKAMREELASTKAYELMTPSILAVGPDEDVELVADKMLTSRIHRVVVVDGNKEILGIASSFDLLLAISQRGTRQAGSSEGDA
jgi:CBS-domain-containing membrane protein